MTSIFARLAQVEDRAVVEIPVGGEEDIAFLAELEELLRKHGKEYRVKGRGRETP